MIEPNWRWRLTSRPFTSPDSGIDRLLQPFSPGEADSEDAAAAPGDRKPAFFNIVLDGKVNVESRANGGVYHPASSGIIEFRAIRSLNHPNTPPTFVNTTLTYEDKQSHETKVQRLW
jgi:hypothetical protein